MGQERQTLKDEASGNTTRLNSDPEQWAEMSLL